MRHARILSLPLFLAVGLAGAALAQDGPTRPTKPKSSPRVAKELKVGVVDIGILFKSYKRKDILEAAINTRRERMQAEVKKEIERIKDMAVRLQKSDLRGEPRLQAEMDIKLANYALDLKQKGLQLNLKKHVEKQTLQILKELQKTIEDYGKRYHYDLILKIDRGGRRGGKGELETQFQEEIFRAQISDILYFGKSLDITKMVKKELNKPRNLKRRAAEAAYNKTGRKPKKIQSRAKDKRND